MEHIPQGLIAVGTLGYGWMTRERHAAAAA